jgi:hypothetical protein
VLSRGRGRGLRRAAARTARPEDPWYTCAVDETYGPEELLRLVASEVGKDVEEAIVTTADILRAQGQRQMLLKQPEDAKLVLRSASLFETTRIPPEALLALWIGEGWPEARFDEALVAALDRALIEHKSEVLDMHQCIARFVDEQNSPTMSDALRRRHFDGFIEAAARFCEHPANPQLGVALRAYPANVTFWSAALAEDNVALAEREHTIGLGLLIDGRFDDALGWFQRAVDAAQRGDRALGGSRRRVRGSSAPSRPRRRGTFTVASTTTA